MRNESSRIELRKFQLTELSMRLSVVLVFVPTEIDLRFFKVEVLLY